MLNDVTTEELRELIINYVTVIVDDYLICSRKERIISLIHKKKKL